MTPAVDYKKALEALGWLKALAGDAIQEPSVETAFDNVEQALQPCAEAMTEDELVDTLQAIFDDETEAGYATREGYGFSLREVIRALAKSGHLKVKA